VTGQPSNAVGAPTLRVEGRLKVTGAARYSADHPIEGAVHAVVVDGTVGRGRITGIDVSAATAQPGVLAVISHVNAPRLPYRDNTGSNNPPGQRLRVFQDDQIRYFGQPVAVVVASTLQSAQHPASLVEVALRRRAALVRPGLRADQRTSDLRARHRRAGVGFRGGAAGRHLPDLAQPSEPDGAARDHRGLGR
jgi:CO/xanthine dehydrogenase Mo-binding subunit